MTPDAILDLATLVALVLLGLAMLLTVVRIIRGPSLADRILGLDLITMLAIGIIAVIAIRTGFSLYIDIAIALGLVGFLSTVALARYLLARAGTRSGRTEPVE
ncbi:MAG TPA: cation:proton antiporter [Alphaproteobacteria bacterium]|nr:cation:proton antiporter [Alphaproteobacteria bacterium]